MEENPNAQPTEDTRDKSKDADPTPATDTNPAHAVDEDPEEHMGEVIDDPWLDPAQTDWPNNDFEEDED